MRSSLATLVDDFRRHGRQTALVVYQGNRRMASTYAELAELSDRFAAELIKRDIHIGDRVVLWGQNGPEWMAAFFGCIQRGVIAVPLDATGSLDFTKRVIVDTQPSMIVGDALLLDSLDDTRLRLRFDQFASTLPTNSPADLREPNLTLDTPLQILFTSGTTAEPKGIVHTHRNILASLAPIEQEMQKYLTHERFVHPLRFLHTLPLSHVFGQFMGLWIPPLLAAEVHFETRLQAQRLIETIRRERISVLVAVPRALDLFRAHLMARHPNLPDEINAAKNSRVWARWWRFRKIHHSFGYKFWAFVCGGASLSLELESFWNTLGFALIQGYGMTETSALITLNHPFKIGKGTIGKVLPGRDVQISEDGEILIRGDMVSTAIWQKGAMQKSESLWLATGDLARRDDGGQLHFLGRKSQVIVTASGLNIHPEDVEAALNKQPGVEAAAVVPLLTSSGTEPAAVLLFRGSRDEAQQAIIDANAQLAEFQRVRQWRIWPDLDFPRTSTGKIQRRKITEWVNAQQNASAIGTTDDSLLALVLSITNARVKHSGNDLRLEEDLGLDSLGRAQLQGELEQRLGITLNDASFEHISTLGDLRKQLGMDTTDRSIEAPTTQNAITETMQRRDIYPKWPWSWPIRFTRILFTELIMQPLVWLLATPQVECETELTQNKPILIIANHVSTYDVPLVLYALPGRLRRRIAPAMAADMLHDWRNMRNLGPRFLNFLGPVAYLLITALFNAFPLPRTAGFRRSFQHAGEALDHEYNVLVFPEGHRSAEGLQRFRSGIGILVRESNAAVLPIALSGLAEMKQGRKRWFRSGALTVRVGTPISFGPDTSLEEITEQLHHEVSRLLS